LEGGWYYDKPQEPTAESSFVSGCYCDVEDDNSARRKNVAVSRHVLVTCTNNISISCSFSNWRNIQRLFDERAHDDGDMAGQRTPADELNILSVLLVLVST